MDEQVRQLNSKLSKFCSKNKLFCCVVLWWVGLNLFKKNLFVLISSRQVYIFFFFTMFRTN